MMANVIDEEQYCPMDPNSFSRPDQLLVTDIHIKWDVNFIDRILVGIVRLHVQRKQLDVDKLVLDTRDLKVHSAIHVESGAVLQFTIGESHPSFGSRLIIALPNCTDESYTVDISYETSTKSSALQWLSAEQTAGKKYPYLFSQCEAIHARSMLPCQDTPSVKTPYTAKVSTCEDLTVLMSAVKVGDPVIVETNKKQFEFKQKIAIPSYLIAIVVGALEKRTISNRIDVWSEKEIVDKAAYEFEEAETMLQTAEKLAGPYVWGRYDILVLPPSFPFGGMENPCLTFVTPTLLAGDRSQATVVAHEISHSWTGNLVTNKNFEHFWLNEGFTVFLERKIVGRMYGEKYREFVSIGGWKELKDTIKTLGDQNPLTRLVVDLKGVDPDDAFSTVPYEKGYAFLYYLEQKVGGPDVFEPFLKSYIEKYKFLSIDTKTWKNYLFNYYNDNVRLKIDSKAASTQNATTGETGCCPTKQHAFVDMLKGKYRAEAKAIIERLESVDWNKWFYQPGMPPETNTYDTTLADLCCKLSQRWIEAKVDDLEEFSSRDLDEMSAVQIQEFLTLLLEKESLPIKKLKAMEKKYGFNAAMNSEIRLRWLRLGLVNHWHDTIPLAIRFVNEQGRMKYVRPIYRALYLWEESRPLAIENFKAHRDEMMYMTVHSIEKELHLIE